MSVNKVSIQGLETPLDVCCAIEILCRAAQAGAAIHGLEPPGARAHMEICLAMLNAAQAHAELASLMKASE